MGGPAQLWEKPARTGQNCPAGERKMKLGVTLGFAGYITIGVIG